MIMVTALRQIGPYAIHRLLSHIEAQLKEGMIAVDRLDHFAVKVFLIPA